MHTSQLITYHIMQLVSAMKNLHSSMCACVFVCKAGSEGRIGGNELFNPIFFLLANVYLYLLWSSRVA